MRRLRRFFGGVMPAGLTGAFFMAALMPVFEPGADRIGPLIVGWFYGVGVLGLTRLFPLKPWGYPLAGILCGPVPLALFFRGDGDGGEQWGGIWLLTAILGLFIGLVEAARDRKPAPSLAEES